MSVLQLAYSDEGIERFNRARDFFGDPEERWKNRLSLERHALLENYRCGRMALALHCEFLAPMVADSQSVKSETARLVHKKPAAENDIAFLIFKAKIVKPHKLQHWDDKFVFVQNIQIVQSPDGVIPSLVGLYRVQHEIDNSRSDLLIFQSAIKGDFKFIPRVFDWESRVFSRLSFALFHDYMPKNIEATAEIVQCISEDKGHVCGGKCHLVKNESQICEFPLKVMIDDGGVKVIRTSPLKQNCLNVLDVLFGPINLCC